MSNNSSYIEDGIIMLNAEFKIVWHNEEVVEFADDSINLKHGVHLDVAFSSLSRYKDALREVAEGKKKDVKIYDLLVKKQNHRIITFSVLAISIDNPETPLRLIFSHQIHSPQLESSDQEESLPGEMQKNTFIDDAILGESDEIWKIRKIITSLANYPNLTVLLEGESGTGKNLIAKVIHYTSLGSDTPFIEVNCAAIPETLIESELFGHKKGTFTHATQDKPGLLEAADGGTLFLNEITETPYYVQAKLLTFLESKSFRPLGDTKEKEVDVRIISATNKNIAEMIKKEKFREDLFYRLNVMHIELPPLRSLKNDLFLIAENFVSLFNLKYSKSVKSLSDGAKKILERHTWPGNVREMRNVIERAVVFTDSDIIRPEHIEIHNKSKKSVSLSFLDSLQLPNEGISLEEVEKKLLEEALIMADGNQTKAAKLLKLSRETFRYRVEKYHLK